MSIKVVDLAAKTTGVRQQSSATQYIGVLGPLSRHATYENACLSCAFAVAAVPRSERSANLLGSATCPTSGCRAKARVTPSDEPKSPAPPARSMLSFMKEQPTRQSILTQHGCVNLCTEAFRSCSAWNCMFHALRPSHHPLPEVLPRPWHVPRPTEVA